MLLLSCAMHGALADDIELFVSTNNQPFQCEAPNVVFLIDTSGSMDGAVDTQAPWDPAQTYSGCFATGSYYYNTTGTPPDCTATAAFDKSANRCAALNGTEYTGEFQAWDATAERWVKLADAAPDWTVECAADEGVDGDGIGAATYAVDGAVGPWSENGDDRIAWGSNASAVTVFDGNWLNWLRNPPTVTTTRLQIVKDVTKAALDNLENINVALMEFNADEGGSLLHAVEDIELARAPIQTAIDGLVPGGQTPLSESMYELAQYFLGGSIEYGKSPDGESVAAARVGGTLASTTYLSPLNSTGQNTYIVLLTDGEPNGDMSANRLIEALPDYGLLVGDPCDDSIEGSCLDSVAAYLNKADLRSDIPGRQNVITHTIGFQVDLPLLASTAERGGGKYFVADNTASLTSVLSNLAKDFSRTSSLLTPPQIPINSFNTADRLDDVYISVFQPAATQHWPGNVKRYRLQETDNGTILVDANGNNAIDPATGTFADNAVSFWSDPEIDGDQAELGGAASQLPSSATRKLLTNVGGGSGLSEVTVANMNITAAMLGAPEIERAKTILWARGVDARDADEDGDVLEDRKEMGDPLHVQPVTVAYGSDEANSNALVFVATNDGYLHAIDATTGVEVWSFIPRRLLSRLFELSLDQPSTNKEYGLDGELRVVEAAGRKILIFGMRRGGEAMFAMDVTSRSNPSLRWVIDSNDAGFLDLGQTWSPATAARVSIGGAAKDVILFGGGYDAGQDNGSFRTDSKGNAIYMVNTLTGELEWSAGDDNGRDNHDLPLARMDFSIPAGLRVLDSDRDGFANRLYVGDMGAQVWRIDFINGNGRASLAEGGVLASLGAADDGAPARADARRFYNTPDAVDLVLDAKILTAINIGSG
ncbi:MAG: PQQ-binding-like beta-propeller repeat protein, partial [Gammaproteobacteria bacterium]|nr:PQQ-binding-like beta-propeller repeat protein [Gammaproteobacteria bacterium]